jgi:hypothetical protein
MTSSVSLIKKLLVSGPPPIGLFQKVRYYTAKLVLPIILIWLTWFSYVNNDVYYKNLIAGIVAGLTTIGILIKFIEASNTETIVSHSHDHSSSVSSTQPKSTTHKVVTSNSHMVHCLIWLVGGQNKYDNGKHIVFVDYLEPSVDNV